jgi:hypothetical protein
MTDLQVAKKMMNLYNSANSRGIEFALSFASVRNLMKAKRCYYSGLLLTKQRGKAKATDMTVDRLDSSKGYVKGNVVACCSAVNQFKSVFEDDNNIITADIARAILKKTKQVL